MSESSILDREKAKEAAAGRLPQGTAETLYAAVENIKDDVERRALRREMIYEACEHKNRHYVQFVWNTFAHAFSDPAVFAEKTVTALKQSGYVNAERHRGFLESVADDDADEDSWTWRDDDCYIE